MWPKNLRNPVRYARKSQNLISGGTSHVISGLIHVGSGFSEPCWTLYTGLIDLRKLNKVQKSILDVFFCLFFQTKTGLPEALQKKWENKPGFQKSGSMHQHVRWSTCVLVYFSFLLDHVIYLKLRRE